MPASGLDESEPQRIETREGHVAWHEVGPRVEQGEPPLVLLHGYTGHRDDWIAILKELAGARRVLAPDLRGHGDSSADSGRLGWSFEQLVNDLFAWLDALAIDRIDLLGHSVGGFVALRAALARPSRIRSLVLVCTGPRPPATLRREGWEKAVEIADARGIDELQALVEKAGRVAPSSALLGWGERYWLHHRRRFGALTPESYREVGRTFFDSESLEARLGEIVQPCLVMVGAEDVDWLPGANLLEKGLTDVRRVTIPAAEHHPHQENPKAFLSALESHLSRVGAAL